MNKIEMKRNLLIAGILTLFLASFVRSSLIPALHAIGAEFHLSAVLLTWIPTLYILVNAILFVPFGRLGDIYGRKRIFQYGLIIYTMSSFLCAFSTSGEMFLFIRIFQSIGNAMMFASLYAIVSSSFTFDKRGKAFGIITMGLFFGLIVGPIFGGFTTHMMGWRTIFIFDAVIGFIITLIVIRFKQDKGEAEGEKFDILGSFILGLSIVLIIYGFSNFKGIYNLFIVFLGFVGLLMFYLVEKRSHFPLINLELFKSKSFTFGNITSMINYSSFIAVNYILFLYLKYIKGLGSIKIGLILSISAIAMLIISLLAGKLSDKINPGLVSTAGMILTTIGIAIMALINENTGLELLILSLIIFGVGNGLFLPSNTKAVISSADKKYYGVVGATLTDVRAIGQVFGIGIVLLVISIFMGNTEITSSNHLDLLISIKISLIILSILSALGTSISILTIRKELQYQKARTFILDLIKIRN